MICYTKTQEIIESSLRRYSVKRAHGKVIAFKKMDGKLSFEVIEGVKRMSCVKVLIILDCNTFDSQLLLFFSWCNTSIVILQLIEAKLNNSLD